MTCTFTGTVQDQASNGSGTVTIGKSTLNGGLCGNGEIDGTGEVETSTWKALAYDIQLT